MRNSITFLGCAVLTVIFMTLSGCKSTVHSDSHRNSVQPDKDLTPILSKVRALAEAEKKIIVFDIVFDEPSGLYCCNSFKLVEHSKKIVDFAKGADPEFNYVKNPFQIACNDTKGNRSIVTCSDRICVANAIAICLKEGNKTTLLYYPPEIE